MNPSVQNPIIAPAHPVELPSKPKADAGSVLKVAAIVILTLLLIGVGLLAVYFYSEYKLAKTEVDTKIDAAVLDAVKAREDELEAEFAEREKTPTKTFTGPADYGSLSLKYPKTWSVHVAKDASSSNSFEAYLHPGEVGPINNDSPFALRVTIETGSIESATDRYNGSVSRGDLRSSAITVNGGEPATRYDGELPNEFQGSVVIFRIRDKVVTLQSDAELYRADFDNIINSITFSK